MHALPFPYRASLLDNQREVVAADVPLAWWPADARKGRAGLDFDHTGEVPLSYWGQVYPLVGSGFILLEDESRLQIVTASEQVFLPHVTLRLRRVIPPT